MNSFIQNTFLVIALLGTSLSYAKFEFLKNGKSVRKIDRSRLDRFLTESEVKVFEPQTQKDLEFKGHDFKKVLNIIYGPSWTQAKKILFTCKDGYQPTVAVETVLKGTPFLSYEIMDYASFAFKKGDKSIDLSPAYLIWADKFNKTDLLKHLSEGNWPYQITKFNLITK